MKAYKAFNADLSYRGFQYEIGKTYTMDEEPVPYISGFYSCENLDDVFIYYKPWANKKVRICEVELDGTLKVSELPNYGNSEISKRKESAMSLKDYLLGQENQLENMEKHYILRKVMVF